MIVDTTVYHFDLKDTSGFPDTFIVTGDIPAMWLRDSTNQIIHYLPLVHKDPMLHALILGVLNRQAKCICSDRYANAFKLSKEHKSEWFDETFPEASGLVWEFKYELDSLCHFLKVSLCLRRSNDLWCSWRMVFMLQISRAIVIILR